MPGFLKRNRVTTGTEPPKPGREKQGSGRREGNERKRRRWLPWALLLLLLFFLWLGYYQRQVMNAAPMIPPDVKTKTVDYSNFLRIADRARGERYRLYTRLDDQLVALEDKRAKIIFQSRAPSYDAIDRVSRRAVTRRVQVQPLPPKVPTPSFFELLSQWSSILVGTTFALFMLWILVSIVRSARRGEGAGGLLGPLGGTVGRRFKRQEGPIVKLSDVAGLKEPKEEVKEIIDFLQNPDRFLKLGARSPKGVLFVGPPGTGKTLLAKAIAHECQATFIYTSAAEFMHIFVGVGPNNVRQLFARARREAPAIIFIDEFDSIGSRGALSEMHSAGTEQRNTINQMLAEMDGFEPTDRVVVIAATNNVDSIDPALLRPGRFDRKIFFDLPTLEERREILHLHARGRPIDERLLDNVAKQTVGLSGADLANLINEAALVAARAGKDHIDEEALDEAYHRAIAGVAKRRALSDEERRRAALHELGHAACALALGRTVSSVSIVARGRGLGYTITPPEQDIHLQTKKMLTEDLLVLLGGRAAELELIGDVSSGAADDLRRAWHLALAACGIFSMNYYESQSMMYYDPNEYPPRLSEHSRRLLEIEAQAMLQGAFKEARRVIAQHRDVILSAGEKLLEKESLNQEELVELFRDIVPVESKTAAYNESDQLAMDLGEQEDGNTSGIDTAAQEELPRLIEGDDSMHNRALFGGSNFIGSTQSDAIDNTPPGSTS